MNILYRLCQVRMSSLASKLGRIRPKWDKCLIFSDQFQLFWLTERKNGTSSQNVLITDLKTGICPQSLPI